MTCEFDRSEFVCVTGSPASITLRCYGENYAVTMAITKEKKAKGSAGKSRFVLLFGENAQNPARSGGVLPRDGCRACRGVCPGKRKGSRGGSLFACICKRQYDFSNI